jgi:hypothetical protein
MKMENQKKIGNVNALNLMNATEESVAGIGFIGNVNFALVTPETAELLQRIRMGNLNATVEIPSGTKLVTHNGQFSINADYFKNVEQEIFFLVNGQMIVEPGLPLEDIEKGLAGIGVNGQFFCPENLMGVFNAKSFQVNGQSVAYPPFKHLFTESLTLDEATLDSLEDGAEISLLGDLSVPKVLANDLLERKIGKLFVSGKILCHEENGQVIRARLYKPAKINTIPVGFEWVKKPLVLDNDTLAYLPGKKLFCKELVRIAPDVQPQTFDQNVEQLIAEDLLLCPSALKPVLAPKCNLFETRVVFYVGALWLVQDEQTLHAARFDSLDGSATLVVTGELTLDATLPVETLSARFTAVHNFGLIRCTPEQHEALRAHLSRYEGEFEELPPGAEEPQVEETQTDQINNVNILVL